MDTLPSGSEAGGEAAEGGGAARAPAQRPTTREGALQLRLPAVAVYLVLDRCGRVDHGGLLLEKIIDRILHFVKCEFQYPRNGWKFFGI
jgi:hypothetical protein